jgi:hypothetical protein
MKDSGSSLGIGQELKLRKRPSKISGRYSKGSSKLRKAFSTKSSGMTVTSEPEIKPIKPKINVDYINDLILMVRTLYKV